jgi:ABC-type ATPase with predicted acetyltransferase domain
MTPITIRYPVRPKKRSLAAATVVDLFGLSEGDDDIVVADRVGLELRPTDLVLFVGPSGSGKSSLMRAAGQQLNALDVLSLQMPSDSIIDALTGPVEERLALLSSCGLAEPRLVLRSANELSDGQRARLRIALGFHNARRRSCLMIDEFAALLDRPTAQVLAYNLRRLVTKRQIGALVATTHEDIADELNPDVVVRCHGEGHIDVTRRDVAKKVPASSASFGSLRAPAPIGRTSLGGITAAMTSASSKRSSCYGSTPNRSASASLPRRSRR